MVSFSVSSLESLTLCHCWFHSGDSRLLGCVLATLWSASWPFSSLSWTCDIVWWPPTRPRLSSVAWWGRPAAWSLHLWSSWLLYTRQCFAAPVQSHAQLCVDISEFRWQPAPLRRVREAERPWTGRTLAGRRSCTGAPLTQGEVWRLEVNAAQARQDRHRFPLRAEQTLSCHLISFLWAHVHVGVTGKEEQNQLKQPLLDTHGRMVTMTQRC